MDVGQAKSSLGGYLFLLLLFSTLSDEYDDRYLVSEFTRTNKNILVRVWHVCVVCVMVHHSVSVKKKNF